MPDSWSTNSVLKSAFTGMTSLSTAPLPGILFCMLSYSHTHKAHSMTFTINFALDGWVILTLPLITLNFFWWNKSSIHLPIVFIIVVSDCSTVHFPVQLNQQCHYLKRDIKFLFFIPFGCLSACKVHHTFQTSLKYEGNISSKNCDKYSLGTFFFKQYLCYYWVRRWPPVYYAASATVNEFGTYTATLILSHINKTVKMQTWRICCSQLQNLNILCPFY